MSPGHAKSVRAVEAVAAVTAVAVVVAVVVIVTDFRICSGLGLSPISANLFIDFWNAFLYGRRMTTINAAQEDWNSCSRFSLRIGDS